MKKEYDFSKLKGRKNPYAKRLKKPGDPKSTSRTSRPGNGRGCRPKAVADQNSLDKIHREAIYYRAR